MNCIMTRILLRALIRRKDDKMHPDFNISRRLSKRFMTTIFGKDGHLAKNQRNKKNSHFEKLLGMEKYDRERS